LHHTKDLKQDDKNETDKQKIQNVSDIILKEMKIDEDYKNLITNLIKD